MLANKQSAFTKDQKIAIWVFLLFLIAVIGLIVGDPTGGTTAGGSRPAVRRTASAASPSWYAGGTLHRKTCREWRQASYRDRLATCADFIAVLYEGPGPDEGELMRRARELESCISIAVSGGAVDADPVAQISSLCIVGMGWR